jgi:predicted glycoside hydrolase/deacetylase ChbG (UPF0249 family)
VFPDHFVLVDSVGSRATIERVVQHLRPGVTEVYIHPAVDTPELRAIDQSTDARIDDLALVTGDALAASLADAGVHRVGWAPLRELMRAG